MKYLVVGSAGLLGEAFVRLLGERDGDEVVGLVRGDVDLCEGDVLESVLRERDFDVMLNCAGMTGLEACLDDPAVAEAVNVEAPRRMAELCGEMGKRFVHFSTDYVFSGEDEGVVDENSVTGPINGYGVSKLGGESAVLEASADALVGRVSWLFGRGRRDFVDQVVEFGTSEGVEYIADKWSVPNFADDLVRLTLQCLEDSMCGVVHLVSQGGGVSWYEYACSVLEIAQAEGLLGDDVVLPNPSQMADVAAFRARRPVHTVMKSLRLDAGELGIDWKEGLRRHLRWKKQHF